MKLKYLAIAAVLTAASASANNYQRALQEIVGRNIGLQTAKIETEALCQENLTGLNLSNPEVEFSYQWGSPGGVRDKKTIDVRQSFDFATLSNNRKRLAERQNMAADCELAVKRQSIAAEADLLMTECVALNRKLAWQRSVISLLKETEADIEKGMERGLYTRLDLNNARLMRRNAETNAMLTEVEFNTSLGRLTQLSGGNLPDWDYSEYLPYQLPEEIDNYAKEFAVNAPETAFALAVANSKEREVALRKSENLPDFSIGYTAEMLKGDNHHGVSVGIELPLWAGNGKVKAAQAAKKAAEVAKEDNMEILRLECQRLYNRAKLLQRAYEESKAIKEDCDNTADLQKLFESGKISFTDYRQAMIPMLEMEGSVLDAEQAWRTSLAEFRQGIFF